MFKFIKDILTEKDGESACPIRVFGVAVGVVYHIGAAWMVFAQRLPLTIDVLGSYIQHMSMLSGISAMGIGAKSIMKADAQ